MKHFLSKIVLYFLILFHIVPVTDVCGQVIETGFGYSSLLHIRRGGFDNNNDGFADKTHCQLLSSKKVVT